MSKLNEVLLGTDRALAKAAVLNEAQMILATVDPIAPISTNALVERIYPAALARGEGVTARSYIYTHLRAAVNAELRPYMTRAEPRAGRGPMRNKMVRPYLWHSYVEPPPVDDADRVAQAAGITRAQAEKAMAAMVKH